MRTPFSRLLLAVAFGLSLAAPAFAEDSKKERDVFDYDGQKAAKNVKKIVFVADTAPHGGRACVIRGMPTRRARASPPGMPPRRAA